MWGTSSPEPGGLINLKVLQYKIRPWCVVQYSALRREYAPHFLPQPPQANTACSKPFSENSFLTPVPLRVTATDWQRENTIDTDLKLSAAHGSFTPGLIQFCINMGKY